MTAEDEVKAAVDAAVEAFGSIRFAVGCAGVGWPEKIVSKKGPHQLLPFETVVRVNLIGMFNFLRFSAAAMNENEPDDEGERGAAVMTASVAAYEGQIGPGGLRGLQGRHRGHDPARRPRPGRPRRARLHDRAGAVRHAPAGRAARGQRARRWAATIPFPPRLGRPSEYAQLAVHIAENTMLNGETIRLDGAIRMAPTSNARVTFP